MKKLTKLFTVITAVLFVAAFSLPALASDKQLADFNSSFNFGTHEGLIMVRESTADLKASLDEDQLDIVITTLKLADVKVDNSNSSNILVYIDEELSEEGEPDINIQLVDPGNRIWEICAHPDSEFFGLSALITLDDAQFAKAESQLGGLALKSLEFRFPVDLSRAKITAGNYVYTGKKITPAVKVTRYGLTFKKGTDYTVKPLSVNVGPAKANVSAVEKGMLYGGKTVSFKILPKGTAIAKLKPAKKAFTVKWKAQKAKMSKKRITGYQVQISLNKKFKSAKEYKVKGYATTAKKIKKLKAKKVYYVRVRTYSTVSGSNYYSKWSKVKAVKTK